MKRSVFFSALLGLVLTTGFANAESGFGNDNVDFFAESSTQFGRSDGITKDFSREDRYETRDSFLSRNSKVFSSFRSQANRRGFNVRIHQKAPFGSTQLFDTSNGGRLIGR